MPKINVFCLFYKSRRKWKIEHSHSEVYQFTLNLIIYAQRNKKMRNYHLEHIIKNKKIRSWVHSVVYIIAMS
jgi:hypothetical protein